MIRHRAIAVGGLALVTLLTACGGDSTNTLPGAADGSGLPGAVTVSPGAPPAGSTDMGYCHVRVEGDVTAEWTSPGGMSAVGYGPWAATTAGTIAGISLDESFFILNCQGDGENYVGFGPIGEATVPMQAATYTIEPGDNVFGASESGMMSVLIGLDGTNTNWGPSAQGQLVITEFDEHHIAGTFSVPVTDVLAQMSGTSAGDAVITGEFEYTNPN